MSKNQEWDNGWRAGYNWSYANSSITIKYIEKDGQKIYKGSTSVSIKNSGQELMDRCDMFQRGYREGLISGSGKFWDDNKAALLKQNNIINGITT